MPEKKLVHLEVRTPDGTTRKTSMDFEQVKRILSGKPQIAFVAPFFIAYKAEQSDGKN